jgi:hypothetical protein
MPGQTPSHLSIVGNADVLVSKHRVVGSGDLDLQAAVLGEGVALLNQVLLELRAGAGVRKDRPSKSWCQ